MAAPKILQVTNIAPQATKDQMQTLFGYLGKIEDIRLYPTIRDVAVPVQSRICYIKFQDVTCVGVAQHLTNTVFIDRALIIVPYTNDLTGEIPDEQKAMELTSQGNMVPGLGLPSEPKLPPNVTNQLDGLPPNQVVITSDPRLESNGLPLYPPLPATFDGRKVEEIRRTVTVANLDPAVSAQQAIDFLSTAGEVKYFRFCSRENDILRYALVEFTDQGSIIPALQMNGAEFAGRNIRVHHATQAIVKPQAKSNEAAQREIEEAMSRVKEAQNLISEAIEPVIGLLRNEKKRSRSRSRSRRSRSRSRGSRRRSHSKSRRSRSRSHGHRSRSRHRHRTRSRSRSRRSHSKSRAQRTAKSGDMVEEMMHIITEGGKVVAALRSKRSRSKSKSRTKRSRSKSKTKDEKKEDKEEKKEKEKPVEEPVEEKKEEPERKSPAEKKEEEPEKVEVEPEKEKKEFKAPPKTKKKSKSRSPSKSTKRRSRSRSRGRRRSRSRSRGRRSHSNSRKKSRSPSRRKTSRSPRHRSRSRTPRRSRRSRSPRRSRSRSRTSKPLTFAGDTFQKWPRIPKTANTIFTKEKKKERERSRDRDRRERDRDRDRDSERDRDRKKRDRKDKDRDRDRDKDRDKDKDREKNREKEKEKDKDREKEREPDPELDAEKDDTEKLPKDAKVVRNYDEEEKGFEPEVENEQMKMRDETKEQMEAEDMDISNSP